MKVTKTAVQNCGNITYTVTYNNQKTNTAEGPQTGTILVDTYDKSKVTPIPTELNGGTDDGAGKITWNIGDVPSGGSGTRTFKVRINDDGCNAAAIPNTVTISGTGTDDNPADNTYSITTTVVPDKTAPTITCPPAVTIGSTDSLDPNINTKLGKATATDNCGTPTVTYSDATAGNCPTIVTRTWKATDKCGNIATCTQIITVGGAAPVITCPPDVTIDCSESLDPAVNTKLGKATATPDTATVTYSDATTGTCPTIVSRTWTATECGSASCVQKITVEDTTAPVLPTLPIGGNLGCNPTPPTCPVGLIATDNCGDVPVICTAGEITAEGCANSQVFTYSATDACGNKAESTVTYTWTVDTVAPVFDNCPTESIAQACNDAPTIDDVLALGLTATDACAGTITITAADISAGPVVGEGCDKSQIFTATATDACNNAATCSVAYTWAEDLIAPELSGCPAENPTVQCYADIPAVATVTALDACDGEIQVEFSEDQTKPGSSCNNVITRTWTATDACGNEASCTQTITVDDTTAPTVTSCPAAETIECTAEQVFGTPVFADNCDQELMVDFEDETTPGNCENGVKETVTRTWTAEDDCGLTVQCSQTLTIVDTKPPVLTGCPTDMELQCYADVPEPETVTALDACDGEIQVEFTEEQTNPESSCNNVITRTWTATDACGNEASCTQTITVKDTTAPQLANVPAGGDLGCNPVPPTCVEDLIANDACDGEIAVSCSAGAIMGDGCMKSQKFTYSASDICGNTASADVTYTWTEDLIAPELSGCPAENPTVQCYADVPAPSTVTALDDCDGETTVIFEEVESNPGSSCDNVITRTWTATDACGNEASCTQTITVKDITAPQLANIPAGGDLGCNPTPPECDPAVTATDNCDPNPIVECTPGAITGDGCDKSQTFTYTAVDACGNVAAEQTVTYTWTEDLTAPELTGCPTENPTVQCYADIPAVATVTALDACDGEIQVEFTEEQTNPGSSCNNEIVRTWTATDACGNEASCTQTITVDDTTAPTVTSCSATESIECAAEQVFGTPVFADNCDQELLVDFEDETTPGNCENSVKETVTRTWTAEDDCGLTVQCSQTLTIVDTKPPVLTGCPTDMELQCNADVPEPETVTALDDCYGDVEVAFSETQTNPESSCNNVITRTWTATDACGNEASCTQTITVNDDQDPLITCPIDEEFFTPADLNAYLAAHPAGSETAIAEVIAEDNCDPEPIVNFVDESDNGASGCGDDVRIIKRTYKATDDCGNYAECTQTITLQIEAPHCEITAPEEVCLYSTGNSASVVPVTGATYYWEILNGVITAGQGTSTITWTAGAPGDTTITVKVSASESEGGCESTCTWPVHISECEKCETAWAYWGDKSTCLYKSSDRMAQNWGWYIATNPETLKTGITADMWAGAPTCVPGQGKGYHVGHVSVTLSVEGDELTVAYADIPDDCFAGDLQVWASTSDPTKSKGKSQWYKMGEPGTITLDSALPSSGTVYIAAHDVVCCSTCANEEYCTYR